MILQLLRDVKQERNELVNLAFSDGHKGISVWILTQQMTSISKPFRKDITSLVLFFTPSKKDMKMIFDDYGGGLSDENKNELINELKKVKYSHLVFSLRHPCGLERGPSR